MAKRGKVEGPARILRDRPQLRDGLVPYWEAFQRLTTCRSIGMTSVGPIPWTAVDHYAHRYEFHGNDYDALVHFLEVLDGVYLQFKTPRGTPDAPNKRVPTGRN